jgi:NADPH2:quinone reductase
VRVLAVGVNYPDALLIRDHYQVKHLGRLPLARSSVALSKASVPVSSCSTSATWSLAVVDGAPWRSGSRSTSRRCVRLPAEVCRRVDGAGFIVSCTQPAYHGHCAYVAEIARRSDHACFSSAAGGRGGRPLSTSAAPWARVFSSQCPQRKSSTTPLIARCDNGTVYPSPMNEPESQRELRRHWKDVVGPAGADVVFDPVGGSYSEPALRSLGPGGRHLVIGFAAGIPRLPLKPRPPQTMQGAGPSIGAHSCLPIRPPTTANVDSLLALWRKCDPARRAHRVPVLGGTRGDCDGGGRRALGKVVVSVSVSTGISPTLANAQETVYCGIK